MLSNREFMGKPPVTLGRQSPNVPEGALGRGSTREREREREMFAWRGPCASTIVRMVAFAESRSTAKGGTRGSVALAFPARPAMTLRGTGTRAGTASSLAIRWLPNSASRLGIALTRCRGLLKRPALI